MNAHRFRNRIAAWLALAGIALNASWPLLANAKPNVPALPSEICTATGQKHAGDGRPGEAPGKGVQPSHCTLCPFNAERGPALASTAGAISAPAPAAAQRPESRETPLLVTAFDPTAPPRAPPFPS
jgi:hypothetical protein